MRRKAYRAVVMAAVLALAGTAQAASVTWDANGATGGQTDGAGAWLGANQWWNGSTNVNWTSGDDAIFGNGGAGGAVTLASPTAVNSLTFNSFSGTYTLGTGSQAITLTNGITMNPGAGNVTVVSPITMAAAQAWSNATANTLTINNNVDNGGALLTVAGSGNLTFGVMTNSGAGGLTKNGTGTLNIRQSVNSYTGTTTLNGGTVQYNTTASLPGGNLVLNGGVLEAGAAGTFNRTLGTGAGEVQFLGGTNGFNETAIANLNITLNNDANFQVVWGSAYFNPAALMLVMPSAGANSQVIFNNKMDLNGENRTIVVNSAPNGYLANITGVISNSTGTAGIIKAGAGSVRLSGNNRYNGPTIVNGGAVVPEVLSASSGPNPFGMSSTVAANMLLGNGATLSFGRGGGTFDRAFTINGTADGDYATIEASASTPVNMTNTLAIAYGTANQARTLILTGGAYVNLLAATLGDNGTGPVSVTKTGANTWQLTGPNSHSGATTVSAGTLILRGSDGSISNSAVTIANATLTVTNASVANNGDRLSDSSAFTLNGGTFNFNNDASANDFSESVGTLAITGGVNTVAIQQAAAGRTNALTFAGLSRTVGVINFSGAGLGTAVDDRSKITFTSPPPLTDGIIGPWATINGTNYAALDGANNLVIYSGAMTDVTRKDSGAKVIPDSSTTDVRIIEGTGTLGNLGLAAATTTIKNLLQTTSGGSSAATIDVGSGTNLLVNSINAVTGAGCLTIGVSANSGTIKPAAAGGNLLLINSSGNTMTNNSVVADNTSASTVTKDGSGTLRLTGNNTYSGGTVLNAGTVWVTTDANLGAAGSGITVNGSAAMTFTDYSAAGETFNLGSRPITVTNGAIATLYLGQANKTLIVSNAVTGAGGVALGRDPSMNSGGVGLSYDYNFLSANNTFTGPFNVGNGLEVAAGGQLGGVTINSLADSASAITMNYASGFYFSFGSTAIANLSAPNRSIDLRNSNPTIRNQNATYTLTLGSVSTTTSGAKTLNLGAGGAGGTIAGAITNGAGTISLLKNSSGAWALGGTNTYSGTTILETDGGQLTILGKPALSPNTPPVVMRRNTTLSLRMDDAGTVNLGKEIELYATDTSSGVTSSYAIEVRNNGGATTGSTLALGKLDFAGNPNNVASSRRILSYGANGYRLQFGDVDLHHAIQGTAAGGPHRFEPQSAPMTITGTIKQILGNTGGSTTDNRLYLGGIASSNRVSGTIADADDYPGNPNATPLNVYKGETGDWTLSGTNSYTGATTINGGKLIINGSTAAGSVVTNTSGLLAGTGTIGGSVTVTNTGGIDLRDSAVGTLTICTNLAINGAAGANNLYFDLGTSSNGTDKIVVTGNVTLATSGAAVITLNQLTGTRVNAGTNDLIVATGTVPAATNFTLATVSAFGNTFCLTGTVSKLQLVVMAGAAGSDTAWTGNSGTGWGTDGNWTAGIPGYGSIVTFYNTGAGNLSTTLDGNRDVGSIVFAPGATETTTIGPGTGGMLTLEAPSGIGITVNTPSFGAPAHTISANVGLATNQTWTVNTNTVLTLSGVISDFGGARSLTKAGTGTLTLNGANTYIGQTIISGGILAVSHTSVGYVTVPNALGMSSAGPENLVLANGATLKFNVTGDQYVYTDRGFTINGTAPGDSATLDSSGTGYRGVALASTACPGYGTANQTRTLILTGTQFAGGNTRPYYNKLSAIIADNGSGAVSVIKNGAGSWGLAGNNTFTGGVTINAGSFLIASSSALGTGPLTINGGYLESPDSSLVNSRNNVQSWNGDFGYGGNGYGTDLNLGTGAVTMSATRTVTVGANTLTVGGVISGAAGYGLTKAGAGTLVLSGANTYDGPTTISAGTLTISSASTFANTSQIGLTGTGRLDVNVANQSLAKLVTGGGVPAGTYLRYSQAQTTGSTGPGTIYGTVELNTSNVNPDYTMSFAGGSGLKNLVAATYTNAIPISGDVSIDSSAAVFTITTGGITASTAGAKTLTLTGSQTGTNTISSVIGDGSGTIAVTKSGAGQWVLTGANTYTGATAIIAGTLTLGGADGSISNSVVTITGATLTLTNAAATVNGDRVSDSSAFTLNGGTFNFNNDASANDFSESVGTLTLVAGANTVAIQQAAGGQTSTLTFAGLSRTAGVINFSGPGLGTVVDPRGRITFTSPPPLTDGIIGTWATVNGSSYATIDANSNVVAYSGAMTDVTRKDSGTKLIPDSSTADVRIIEGTGTLGNLGLAAATTTIRSLMQSTSGGTSAATIDIGTGTNLLVDSINQVISAGSLTIGVSGKAGTLKPATGGGNLLLINNSANTLTINSVVADNTSASSMTKDGAGLLRLSGANTFSGGVVVNQGTVWVTTDVNLGAAGSGITVNGSCGLSFGDNTAGGQTINLGSRPITVSNGAVVGLYFNGANKTITTTGAITGAGGIIWGRDPVVTYGGGSGGVFANLLSTGNTFTGPITIGVNASENVGATTDFTFNSLADSSSPMTFNFGGGFTFSYGAGATANVSLPSRPINLLNSSTTFRNLNATYTLTLGSVSTSTSGGKTLNLSAAGAGCTVAGAITDGAGTIAVTKSGSGAPWYLGGTNTYSGTTTISDGGGTLGFQNASKSVSASTTIWIGGSAGMRLLDDGAGTVSLGNNVQVGVAGTGERDGPTIFVGNNNTANGGFSSGITSNSTIALGTFDLSYGDGRSTQILTITGTNSYRFQMGGLTIAKRADFGAPQLNPTTAPLTLTGVVTMASGKLAGESTAGDTLELMGTATNNLVSGVIRDAADYGSNPYARPLSILKSGTGDWTLSGSNTYSGGTTISAGILYVNSANALGAGNVTLSGSGKLVVLSSNVTTRLYLPSATTTNLILNADMYVSQFFMNGVLQVNGIYTATGRGTNWLGGAGTLTVGPASMYWDVNGATSGAGGGGAPAGTWDAAIANWNASSNGTDATAAWGPGQGAIFAAGTDASGTYTVTVDGTKDIGGLTFEEGNVTLSGGTALRLVTDNLTYVATNLTATLATPITQDATARSLYKGGPGTLILSGNNAFAGSVSLTAGTLQLAHTNALGTAAAGMATASGTFLQLRSNTAATFNTPTNTISQGATATLDVNNNGSGSGHTLTLLSGLAVSAAGASTTTINITGGNGYTLRVPTLNWYPANAAINLYLNPTTASLVVDLLNVTAAATPILYLDGSATGNVLNDIFVSTSLNVTKQGTGTWTWNRNTSSTAMGAFLVNGGNLVVNGTLAATTITLQSGTLHGNNPSAVKTTLTITGGNLDNSSGAAITTSSYNPPQNWNGNFGFIGNSGTNSDLNIGTGAVALNATRQVTVSNALTTLTVGGVVSGAGFGITKSGAGTLKLTGANTYTGITTVNAGTLELGGAGLLQGGTYTNTIVNNATFRFNSSADQTISGIISGSGTFIKTGAGVLTLSTNNTCTGDLVISNGMVKLSGTGSVASATVTIWPSGTLDVTNKASHAMTSANTYTFAITNSSVGAITAGTLDITAGRMALSGAFTNAGAYVIATYTNRIGTAFAWTNGSYTIDYNYGGSNKIAIIQPSPNTPYVVNAGTNNQTSTSCTLQGMVTNGASADAWICWGTNDAGTVSTANWQNVVSVGAVMQGGPFSTVAAGLSTNVTYWYRCYAVNAFGVAWSDPPTSFSAAPASGGGGDGGGGTGGGSWTPSNLTSVALWLDAADTNTVLLSGSSVTNWLDKSGNGRNVTQGTAANQPTNGATINGINAVNFDGANDFLVTSSNFFGSTISNAFVITVHKYNSNVAGGLFSLSGSETSGNRWNSHAPWNDGIMYFDCGGVSGANRVSTSYGVSVGDKIIASFYCSVADNVQQVYKNATLLVGDASGHAVTTAGNVYVGGITTMFQSTSIGEFVVINGTVSTVTRQKLEGYLAWKWGLQGNLPADHPFKLGPPSANGGVVTYTDSNGLNPTNTPYAGGYVVHTFYGGSDTFSNSTATSADVLVVGGGGGGGGSTGGGGGAGGYVYSNAFPLVGGSNYQVAVGLGGAGGINNAGVNGSNSVFGSLTAYGGGGGGANAGTRDGQAGGSGGGGSYVGGFGIGGAATNGQGNTGGVATFWTSPYPTGGGGGAGSMGSNGTETALGHGGVGKSNDISGVTTWYAGGGGGGNYNGNGGNGGLGGGGLAAGNVLATASNGVANTGGGGGGMGQNRGTQAGSGGSGIVIVRYPYGSGASYSIANLAPTAITNTAAVLNASLSCIGTNVDVYVHWGFTDGTNNSGAWANSQIAGYCTNAASTNVSYTNTSLSAGLTYYYTFRMTNATTNIWASPSWRFSTPVSTETGVEGTMFKFR